MNLKQSIKNILKKNKFIVKLAQRRYAPMRGRCRLNIYKTLLINFKTQSFRNAMKFPIYVYGKVRFYSLHGKITIDAPIKRGMIRFGYNSDLFSAEKGSAMLNLKGEIIFKGYATLSVDYALDILGKIELDEGVFVGNSTKIRCWDHILIGKQARLTVECQIFDTNFHYVRNIETGKVQRLNRAIVIGDYCWIGNRTTVMKGTKLPDYTIVAGNSLVNKDFTKENVIAPTIAGMPGKIITSGNLRIFSDEHEAQIEKFFKENPSENIYYTHTGLK